MKFNPRLVLINKKFEQENNSMFDKGVTNKEINLKKREKWNKIANQGKNIDLFKKQSIESDSSNEGITENFKLNKTIAFKLQKFGYPYNYIKKCLKANECNYCTTAYYLLCKD